MRTDSDPIDDLLDRSSPRTTGASVELDADVALVIAAARREADRRIPQRWLTRPAIAGILSAVLLGTAATAAAVTVDEWSPWAQSPDGTITYTLPSGATCEQRFGNVKGKIGKIEPVAEAIRDYLGQVDILEVADIEGEIDEIRAGESVMVIGGSHEPAGYGTEYYNADQEYAQAVDQAVNEALTRELVRQGFELDGLNLTFEGEAHCPGAEW